MRGAGCVGMVEQAQIDLALHALQRREGGDDLATNATAAVDRGGFRQVAEVPFRDLVALELAGDLANCARQFLAGGAA